MLVRFRADVGARDAGVEFGPERDRIAAAILERVHLLRDDIGGLTERAREHGRRLEHRDFEALEAIEPPHAIEHIGDAREAALVLAENVLRAADRSEEHTSELQALMRLSYAVFCLKKKK